MAYQENLFTFNLIPPITSSEVKILEERDNSILYSFVLIFISMLVFVILNILLLVVIQGRKSTIQNNITLLERTLTAESEPLKKHGAIVVKSNFLSPILQQDIKMSELLTYARQIAPNSEITKYGRELSGMFRLEIKVNNLTEALDLVRRTKTIESISHVSIDSIINQSYDSDTGKTVMNVRFNLNSENLSNGS